MDMTTIARPVGTRAVASATSPTRSPALTNRSTLLLTRSDVTSLLRLPECIDAVEKAFRLHAEERSHLQESSACPSKAADFTSR